MSSSVIANTQNEQQNSFSFDETQSSNSVNNSSVSTESSPHAKAPSQPCLQLKGSLVPMTTLELNYFDADQFTADLREKTSQAPDFFDNLPVVIGLEKVAPDFDLPFGLMIGICAQFSIKIVAIRGGSEAHQAMAKQAGLGTLPKQKEKSTPEAPQESAPAQVETRVETKIETVEVVKTVVEKERQVSKIIHHPVRSGQQVYASDGDLIVLASVSAGAEILADGNIHVYGALRGRALAGVKGDTSARIFCQSLEAELVSVAGQYKISEDIDKNVVKKASQVYLDNDSLCFKEIEY